MIPALLGLLVGGAALAQEPDVLSRQAQTPGACAAIPARSGTYGLYFNPDGMAQYFYRSQCYLRIALEQNDLGLCAEVREKRMPFGGDGSYYSPQNCRAMINQRLAQAAKREVAPAEARQLLAVTAEMTGPEPRFTLHLGARGLEGRYRVVLAYEFAQNGAPVFGTFNDRTMPYVDTLEPGRIMVQGHLIDIGGADRDIPFEVTARQWQQIGAARRDPGTDLSITASLSLFQPDDGALQRVDALSRAHLQTITFAMPPPGSTATFQRP